MAKQDIKYKRECTFCNFIGKDTTEFFGHLKFVHQLTFEQYILQTLFNNEYPKCKCGCGTIMKFRKHHPTFFADYTSNHFPRKPHKAETIQRIKESLEKTMMEKYGVHNVMELRQFVDKIAETKQQKYGDKNYNNPKKGKETRKERYGDENYQNSQKIIETNQQKYGANSYTASEEGKRKIKEIFQEKYGYDNVGQVPEFKEKIKQTKKERYGYECEFSDPAFRRKYNKKTSDIEKEICKMVGGEKFYLEGKEYDIRVGNDIIEIENEFHHPWVLSELTLMQINSLINDKQKIDIAKRTGYNLSKVRISNLPKDITIDNLISRRYQPDYSLLYKQKIITKDYFIHYLTKKDGFKKLKGYSLMLLKFVRTFHQQFPYPELEENISEIITKIPKSVNSSILGGTYFIIIVVLQ